VGDGGDDGWYCQECANAEKGGGGGFLGGASDFAGQQEADGAADSGLGDGQEAVLKRVGGFSVGQGDLSMSEGGGFARSGFLACEENTAFPAAGETLGRRETMNRPPYVLVLAGGSGERFWPLSRKTRPKQLLSLFGGESLLGQTVARLEGFVPAENVLVLTNAEQEAGVRALGLPIPAENILAEPSKRDTAPAIALGVGWVAARDPKATMLVLPADHLIRDRAAFQRTLGLAVEAAEQTGELVTIGIQPTWACPSFGYVEQGGRVELSGAAADGPVYEVRRFREKPSEEVAAEFLKQGNFRWNAGIFAWTLAAVRRGFMKHAPELEEFIQGWPQGGDVRGWLAQVFPTLPKISVDYALLEKAGRVLMVEAGFDWDDVGSWTALGKYLPGDTEGNAANCPLHVLEAGGNLVFSEQKTTVTLLGVSDLIIVQTGDALLVCSRKDAEKVKHLLPQLPAELL